MQQVKNNKEDSIALADHAREMTSKLVDTVQGRNDQDSLKPIMENFSKYVVLCRTLNLELTYVVER
jgi:hypothetical protein